MKSVREKGGESVYHNKVVYLTPSKNLFDPNLYKQYKSMRFLKSLVKPRGMSVDLPRLQ